ncbi:MAG: calcium-binding protein [Nostoc sp.]|uniref:calcium-binding protein n=1 Tax=Nostoc sp. TaxID=1180 RepID=UPI002FFC7E79
MAIIDLSNFTSLNIDEIVKSSGGNSQVIINGNKIINASSGNQNINGTNGNDIINTGNGNDVINGANANDIINAGNGNNTLNGGNGNDILNSGSGNDRLIGENGNDILSSGGGNDILTGGSGNDTLAGGTGTDVLTGGAGNDVFKFSSVSDSAVVGRDLIADFGGNGTLPGDQIDLSAIDADSTKLGNQAFNFIGAAAFSAPGQLRYSGGILQASTDADRSPEFEVRLINAPLVVAQDFIL